MAELYYKFVLRHIPIHSQHIKFGKENGTKITLLSSRLITEDKEKIYHELVEENGYLIDYLGILDHEDMVQKIDAYFN